MSATKKPDVSFNITTSLKYSKVDIETGDLDYCVAEFYEVFKDQLPCLVVVDQGFCSPLTQDTFDKEQMLLLKTTSSQKRVLGKMAGIERRQQTKLISLPVNYKEKLFIFKNGKVEKKTTLDVVLKENALPCKVAFADSREVLAGDRAMSTKGLTIIELTELFDEVYFLGNCVNFGQLALDVIQVPFYLSRLTFKIINGFKDMSKSSFKEYIKNLLLVSSFLNYNVPCGNIKIAEYDTTAVHSKGKLSLLQPNLYTDYETWTLRPTSDKLDVLNPTSSLGMTLKRDRPLPPLPRESSPPPNVPDRKLKSESFTLLAETVGPKRPEAQTVDERNQLEGQIVAKKFEAGKEYHTVAKGDESRDTKPFEPELDYDKMPERDKQRAVVRKALPVLATQKQEMAQFDDDGTAKAFSNATEQRGKRTLDVKTLSIQDVSECLTHLNLHEYRNAFRDDMIDGDLLMDIDRDTLCTHFGMNKIEALRLVKFAATGRIPK